MALFGKDKKQKEEKKEVKEVGKNGPKLGLPEGKDPALYKIIEKPVVTEKAVGFSGKNKHVFRVSSQTNKAEIKKAIEKLYGVKVKDVRVLNVVAKKRQVGRFVGWRSGFKKAMVTLKKGYKIESSNA